MRADIQGVRASARSIAIEEQDLFHMASDLIHKSGEMSRDEKHTGAVQQLCVYEINERDRGSPVVLPFGGKKDESGAPLSSLGDMVPFSNKVNHHWSLSLADNFPHCNIIE